MNTIYYASTKNGSRETVKIGRGRDNLPGMNAKGVRSMRTPARRPTMAEADATMLGRGFIRWPRNKPLPRMLADMKRAA